MNALVAQGRREVAANNSALTEALRPPAPCHLTPEQQKDFERNVRLVTALLRRAGETNLSEATRYVAQHWDLSVQRVRQLYYLHKHGGAHALEPKPLGSPRGSRRFNHCPKLKKFVLAKWAESLGLAHIRDIVKRDWGGALLPYKDEPPPSYGVIRSFLQKEVPQPLRDYARLPRQKWEAKHAPFLTTGRGQWTRPNQCWVGDHRIYDVRVMNDFLPNAPQGAAVRLWETCIQDMRTRVIVGSVWNVTPSWRTIASALRQAISRFGLPEVFYCDNGKDFRKVGAGARRGSLLTAADSSVPVELDEGGRVEGPDGILARLGVQVCYCRPRHPQAKQIESYFNFVGQRFDKMFSGRGYTGPKPEMRPDFCRDAERQHKEFLAGKRRESPLCRASHFIELHAAWLDERNRTQPHGGRGMAGRRPMDLMEELLPEPQRRIPNMVELAPLFWDVQERAVANGKVQLNNATYSAALDDPEGQQAMFLANGGIVAIHCDPSDLTCALAFENRPSGALLARLVSDELMAQGPVTADQLKAVMVQRAKLRKATRESLEFAGESIPSEITLLEQRAGIQPARLRLPRRAAAPAPRYAEEFIERLRKAE